MPLSAVCYVSGFPSTIEVLHSLYQPIGRRLRNLVIVDCHVAWSRVGIYKIERLQDRAASFSVQRYQNKHSAIKSRASALDMGHT